MQELVTPSVSKYANNNNDDTNDGDDSFIDYSQTELYKNSKVENKLNEEMERLENKQNYFKNKLSLIQFTIMIFLINCGGPFGIEESINSIGIFYTFIGLIIIPFIFSIPQSLISSELSSIMTSNHGYICWVYRAFCTNKYGDILGFINSLNHICVTMIDLPIYIILLFEYLKNIFELIGIHPNDLHFMYQYLIKLLFILIGTIINVLNIKILGKTSIIFLVGLLPFLFGFIYSLIYFDIDITKNSGNNNNNDNGDSNNNNNWLLGISTLIWLYSKLDVMLMCCGEIKFKKKNIYIPFVIVIILDFIIYQSTIFVISSSPLSDQCIDFNCLPIIYDGLLKHLGIFISISGIISMFAKYNILLSAHSRSLWAISQPYITLLPDGKMYIIDDDQQDDDEINDNNHNNYNNDLSTIISNVAFDDQTYNYLLNRIPIGILPSCLGLGNISNKTKSPINAVIFTTLINSLLIFFQFDILIEITMFLSCFTFIFKILAFLKLRYSAPLIQRPFKIIGGIFIAWIITISQILIIGGLIFITIEQKPNIFIFSIGVNVIFIIFYLFSRYSCNREKNKSASNSYLLSNYELSQNQSYNTPTSKIKDIW